MILIFIAINICFCNKNTDQLPSLKPSPEKLTISSLSNGLTDIDFIFSKIKIGDTDTVSFSIKNNSQGAIENLVYLVEICQDDVQSFSSCNIIVDGTLPGALPPGAESGKLHTWVNKGIELDKSRINVGIISKNSITNHPLANIYDNNYCVFVTEEIDNDYYGKVRGYILIDGTAIFRFEDISKNQYNAVGLFVNDTAFHGRIENDNTPILFKHDSIQAGSENLTFRLKLQTPINNTVIALFANTKSRY